MFEVFLIGVFVLSAICAILTAKDSDESFKCVIIFGGLTALSVLAGESVAILLTSIAAAASLFIAVQLKNS